jgi:hypothetical protein
MWSGPRNISTAMMRSFENRKDASVIDEPFYAAYLVESGIDHPMRAESIASLPNDWRDVVRQITGPVPGGRAIWYQKHMTHHMLPGFGRAWIASMRNAFLIRDPESVLVSYTQKRSDVALDDTGFVQQAELFDAEAQRLGHVPPVIHSDDILANPRGALSALCAALDIPFSEQMLSWPAGKRATDGVWAPVWYVSVEKSTCFARPEHRDRKPLTDDLRKLADRARPHYERLAQVRLKPL